jgi:hypothetical protein
MSRINTETAAQMVNDVLLEEEGRPESRTNSDGSIIIEGGKLKGSGHTVTTEVAITPTLTTITLRPQNLLSYELGVPTESLTEEALSIYAAQAHEFVTEMVLLAVA